MPRGRPKKDKFEDLDIDFKTLIENASEEDIRKKISEVAIAEHENQAAKKADVDLATKAEEAKLAGEQYREGTKLNKLRISYAHYTLAIRGKI